MGMASSESTLTGPADLARNCEWVSCAERLPALVDSDCDGDVWVFMPYGFMGQPSNLVFRIRWDTALNRIDHLTHWMPTGLKRPAAPQLESF